MIDGQFGVDYLVSIDDGSKKDSAPPGALRSEDTAFELGLANGPTRHTERSRAVRAAVERSRA